MSADLLPQDLLRGGGASEFLSDDIDLTDSAAAAAVALYNGGGGVMSDADFVGLSVSDFDLGEEMQELDGFPIDLWSGAIESAAGLAEESLGLEAKLGTDFSCLEEEFHQMLDEWDSQLGSLQASDLDTLPPTVTSAEGSPSSSAVTSFSLTNESDIKTELAEEDLKSDVFLTSTSSAPPTALLSSSPTTICVRRPQSSAILAPASNSRGLVSAGLGRQLPVSNGSAMRSSVISRGFCYTRTGGLGVTRSVQSCGLLAGSAPTRTATLAVSTAAASHNIIGGGNGGGGGSIVTKLNAEDPTFVFTPVSPRSAPSSNSSSNAPDFFVASTRSTADVKSSYSSYCRVLDPCLDLKTATSSSSSGMMIQSGEYHQVKSEFGSPINTTTGRMAVSPGPPSSPVPSSHSSSQQVKIFASLSPKRDGSSSTRIISSRSIRDSLPKELIEKIKAASQGRKTIAIIEPITRTSPTNRLELSSSSSCSVGDYPLLGGGGGSRMTVSNGLGSRFSVAAANLNRWRSVGVVPPLSNSNNNISDHDYCCPSRPGGRFRSRLVTSSQSKMLRQIEDSLSRSHSRVGSRVSSPVEEVRKGASSIRMGSPVEDGNEARKDSGLESCEMSDCSEDGGLYDRLPGYLTNVSVQTVDSMGVMEEHGYNRLPSYLVKPQQSLLKSNVARSLERSTMVVAPLEHPPVQKSAAYSSHVVEVEEGKASPADDSSPRPADPVTCPGDAGSGGGSSYISNTNSLPVAPVRPGDDACDSKIWTVSPSPTSTTSQSPSSAADSSRPAMAAAAAAPDVSLACGLKRRRESSDSNSSSSDDPATPAEGTYRKKRFLSHREYKGRNGLPATALPERRGLRCRRRSSSCSSSPDRRSYRRRQLSAIAAHSSSQKRRTSSHRYQDNDDNDDRLDYRGHGYRGNSSLQPPDGRRPPGRRSEPQQETQRQVEERRVIYVGGIAEGTLRADLRQRFEQFGPILDMSLHFRERGSNYGFVTFKYKVDAYAAVEHGNDDPSWPRYELSFGGRRAFCREKYFDLDDVDEASGDEGAGAGFDELLRRARGKQ